MPQMGIKTSAKPATKAGRTKKPQSKERRDALDTPSLRPFAPLRLNGSGQKSSRRTQIRMDCSARNTKQKVLALRSLCSLAAIIVGCGGSRTTKLSDPARGTRGLQPARRAVVRRRRKREGRVRRCSEWLGRILKWSLFLLARLIEIATPNRDQDGR